MEKTRAEVPTLRSKNYILRPILEEDIPQLYQLRSDPDLMKYIHRPILKEPNEAIALYRVIEQRRMSIGNINWALCTETDPTMKGFIGFAGINKENNRAELGYMIMKELQGKKLMYEVLPLLIEYGFETMNMNALTAIIDPANIASEKVLIHCGLRKEAHFREEIFFEGKYYDALHYCILKSDYKSRNTQI